MTPFVTVAIPTCNGERHVAECLAGILDQEGAAFDLLVCDDRSDERTLEMVRARAGDRARIVENSERLGLAGNWNRCMAESRTPWTAIFHQDDVMRAGHLRGHLAVVRAHAKSSAAVPIGLIASPSDVIDASSRPVPADVIEPGRLSFADSRESASPALPWTVMPAGEVSWLALGNPLRCSAVTTSKRAHAAVGGFDPSYRYVVDWDFWVRVCERFSLAAVSGEPTVSVRWHAASETHRFKATLDDLDETERMAVRFPTLDRRAYRRKLARAYLNRALDAARAGRNDLAREALERALRRSPAIFGTIARDPRLAARLARAALTPWSGI